MTRCVRARMERASVHVLGRLPRPLVRRLAGQAVVIDGRSLHPLVVLALKGLGDGKDSDDHHPIEQRRSPGWRTSPTTSQMALSGR